MDYKILSCIKSPDDVKKLNNEQLAVLCEEIRSVIIETISKNGGHLASNLGVVELTVALHRVFSSPEDSIIFDVGHQCYSHKLLTGRFEKFSTIRTEGGLSGYMRPQESEHDPFVTGHSSNSISAAYGIYKAKSLNKSKGTAIAVIGDGAMTGGMAYEALNNVGNLKAKFIVILNDNKMSISKNVGSISRVFTKLRNRPKYHTFKFAVSRLLIKIPFIGNKLNDILYSAKEFFKGVVYRNNIFSSLGFNYLGPVDGHNINSLESLLKIAKVYDRPVLVHVVTTKGKGYKYAEDMPKDYHGVSAFDVQTGTGTATSNSFSDVAGKTLCKIAKSNEKVCAVTAAMKSGTGLSEFAAIYKDRFFDVGIAEQHAVTFTAGLAAGGMVPFFAVYSSFLQRGFDQIIHDCAIAGLPVKFLIDRAGIVGEDGETHQGIFDAAYLSTIPGISLYSPCYYRELEQLIQKTANDKELCAIRYPRGCENNNYSGEISGDYTFIKGVNSPKLVITYGRIFSNVYDAVGELKNIDIIKLNKIFPIVREIFNLVTEYKEIHFYEEGIKSGGIAEHFGNILLENGFGGRYIIHAIDNEFVPAAHISSSFKKYGFDTDSIKATLLS
ncbi:MAG: 1-deoxy-D-xylulose-5-phosphate synthase [Clostridia bacterium]|nr:1-deoxy-D-xylulose-5-phosphate synthase [Clostridia bacterium]